MNRIQRNQEKRCSVYCTGEQHVTVIDPLYPYSGEAHQIELTPCDCPKPEHVEPPSV